MLEVKSETLTGQRSWLQQTQSVPDPSRPTDGSAYNGRGRTGAPSSDLALCMSLQAHLWACPTATRLYGSGGLTSSSGVRSLYIGHITIQGATEIGRSPNLRQCIDLGHRTLVTSLRDTHTPRYEPIELCCLIVYILDATISLTCKGILTSDGARTTIVWQ